LLDIKRFKLFYAKVIGRYLRKADRVLNGLEMVLNGIVKILYVIDILYLTEIDDIWGIGI
jgi:hypothetical protein